MDWLIITVLAALLLTNVFAVLMWQHERNNRERDLRAVSKEYGSLQHYICKELDIPQGRKALIDPVNDHVTFINELRRGIS